MRGMPLKDYYVVLNVPPQASPEEIKVSYRKLALKYHPDRNGGNVHTEALFKEINEAYSVLSNQQKREEYNRMRSLQHQQSTSRPTSYHYAATGGGNGAKSQHTTRQKPPVTGKTVLFQSIHLRKLIEQSNPFAINSDGLLLKIEAILSDAHLHLLQYENKRLVNSQILHELLFCSKPLPANYFYKITSRLYRLAGNDAIMRNAIQQAIKSKKQDFFWQKYKILFVMLLTLIILLFIYFM